MELKINIVTGELCSFNIKDITTISPTGYLSESSEEKIKNRFKYSETVSLISLGIFNSKNYEYSNCKIIRHVQAPKYEVIPTEFDGCFEVSYIVIPTKEWFEKSQSEYLKYSAIYFSDGIKIYKYFNGETSEVEVNELIQINPINTTISIVKKKCVSICRLKKCYVNICQQILEQRTFTRCASNNRVSCELIDNRDLVWMTINVISYLTQFGQFHEVQRIMDLITSCNGICKQNNRSEHSNGCGCS